MKKKLAGTWKKKRILASPNNSNKFATGRILEKTGRSWEGTDFSWLSSKVSQTLVWSYNRGEPVVSYIWTNFVWDITGWSSRLQENYWSFKENLQNIPQIHRGKAEDVNVKPVGLANTRISTGYAQKSPRGLVWSGEVNSNFHAPHGWDGIDWPQVTWEPCELALS